MTIKACTCKHEAQDAMHGKGNRVHTESKKGELNCTVCGNPPASVMRLITHAKQFK